MFLGFLKIANNGISLNSIAFRIPTHIYRSDSCPSGLGGYSGRGWAWRWYLPKNLQFLASNNLLEHLAVIISPWIEILAGRLKNQDCVLSMTDSTTAKGWLRKSNLPIGQKPHLNVCQDRSMSKAGNPLHIPRHQMLQPMVCRREKPSVRRSLL